MGARWLLIYVIYQTVITESLSGATLPFSDLIGKVTPIKPKPLSPSTVSSVGTSSIVKSSVVDGDDMMPKLPERLGEKFLPPKLCNAPLGTAKPYIRTPEVSLSYKYPFLSSPTNPPNALPPYSSSDIYSTSLNKLSSLPSIKSLPVVPLESLKSNACDLISSASKTDNTLAPLTYSLPRSRMFNSPLTLEARKPSLFPLSSSTSLPYPLYYKSMCLPGVRTSEILPLNYNLIFNTGNQNFNIPSQCNTQSLLSSLSEKNEISALPYADSITTSDISKPANMIQVPKTSSNIPYSTKSVLTAQNAAVKNLRLLSLLEDNSGSASLVFKSRLEPSESLIPSIDLRGCKDPLLSSLSCTLADKISDCKQQPLNPPKISLTNYPTCFNFDVMPNFMSNIDRNLKVPKMYPVIDTCVETIDRINSIDVPRLKEINVPESFKWPERTSNQYSSLPKECISNSLKFSPPIIPLDPIPTISSGTSTFSPYTCYPRILQTPVTPISYINQSSTSPLAQSTLSTMSDVNDLVSDIAQNVLSSHKSYLNSAPQNAVKSNPYNYSGLESKQTLSVLPLPPGNSVNAKSISPIISSTIDPISLPDKDTSTVVSLDVPSSLSALEVSSSQLSPMSSSQPLTVTLLPLTSLITFPSPQLCPSYLPSPTLPSYPSTASPFYMEASVFKVSSSKKHSNVEKLTEVMLLAEILNSNSFDWDDLDTLLALLSFS